MGILIYFWFKDFFVVVFMYNLCLKIFPKTYTARIKESVWAILLFLFFSYFCQRKEGITTENYTTITCRTCYTNDFSIFQLPRGCTNCHHEVELGVVIGSVCCDVEEKDVMSHIAGYALALDMTARDFQDEAKKKGNPWTMAKCFDTALPVSKFLSKQELVDPSNVNLWCKVMQIMCFFFICFLLF